jgi:nitrate reductase gamma subunit
VPIITSDSKRNQFTSQVDPEVLVMGLLVIVAIAAIAAVLVVVVLSHAIVDQVASNAIAAISGVGLAAIGTFGLVLRRRSQRTNRSS